MKNPKEETSDWFFHFILLKGIFWIIIFLFYLFFYFQHGYGTTEWSEFILTEINGWYNSNDRWKFFFFLIGRENGLNDRLKLVKNGRKEIEIEWNKNESQETRNELKVSNLETYPSKNGWTTVNNRGKPSRICLRKYLGSVMEAPQLGFSSRKQFFFHQKQLKYITRGIPDP